MEKGVVRAGRLQPLGEVRPQELGREVLSPMAQDAAPMPVRSSSVPTMTAATLGLEQHGAVRTPAIDTKLGSLPGLCSAQQGLGSGLACGASSPVS